MKNLSLRSKLMVITSGLIIISLIVLSVISIRYFAQDKTDLIKLQTNDTAKLIAERLKTEIGAKIEALTVFDRYAAAASSAGSPRKKAERKKGKAAASAPQTPMAAGTGVLRVSRYIYNASGISRVYKRDIASAQQALELGADLFERDEGRLAERLKAVFKGQTLVLTRTQAFGKPVWFLAFPIIEGQVAERVVAAYLSSEVLDSAFTSRVYTSFFVDSDRAVIVHTDKKETLAGRSLKDHPAVVFLQGQETKAGFSIYPNSATGHEYFGAYSKLEVGSTAIVVELEKDKALESVRLLQITAALIAGIIILVALILVYFFAKTISEPVRELRDAAEKIKSGDYHLRLTPRSGDEVGALTQSFNEMAVGLEEREKLKGALGKFVNPEIAEKAMKGELKLGGERRTATIFFSDIRSFTAISEQLQPEEVVEFLNAYMTIMVKIIGDHNGIVDKFIGDAIMAVWGVPESKGNDALNAVNATIEMRRALLEFNKGRGSAKKPIIKIGCGLNTGAVLAGQIGSEDRLDYTVIGDAVNLASRVETLNKPFGTDILISQDTYNVVKNDFDCEPMQKIKVKGKSQPQQIYAVLRKKGDKNGPKDLKELRKLLGIDMSGKPKKSGDDEEVKYEILEG
ncbi:adenylate/guanylate cyclase domain-containing protein [Turneriella parva]|uniref:Adenylate/guanylate cyclase with integral membrane sensor n=1 Tax=Turneriella parva (strain ATCC BAA-1111 / DSM 21527 / NCTC 11395 / H) TaxID=869212 RepID=I4B563_TURPD|nr:adenylate/guanylate cyclase domain-containing protein [Turneriella parva]AFM12420.1 adenylate/guanylate cyclase with integral membrane sensor [Turneriella parva DSM 21527]